MPFQLCISFTAQSALGQWKGPVPTPPHKCQAQAQRQESPCALNDWWRVGAQAFSSLSPKASVTWPHWPKDFQSHGSSVFQQFPGISWKDPLWRSGVAMPQSFLFFSSYFSSPQTLSVDILRDFSLVSFLILPFIFSLSELIVLENYCCIIYNNKISVAYILPMNLWVGFLLI